VTARQSARSAGTTPSSRPRAPGPPDGRFLLIITPAGLEPFFDEFSLVPVESPDEPGRQAEVAGRYGIEIV